MKKLMIFLLLGGFMYACGGGGSSTVEKPPKDMPKWIYKPGLYEDVIIAAGIGSGLTERKAKSQAGADGRKKIAETLQTQIQSMTTNFLEEASTMTDDVSETAAQEYFQEITRSITNVTLNGAQLVEYWPPLGMKEGNKTKYYAKLVLKKNSIVDAFKKQVEKDAAAKKINGVKISADNALKALDKAISKWESSSNMGDDE